MSSLFRRVFPKQHEATKYFLIAILIFILTFLIYKGFASLLGRQSTPMAYWDLLAQSFLHGKLYLVNPPTTWDLTFFHGQWYVAPPPLAAILMLPIVAIAGDINTVSFSIFFAAINCMLVFVLLRQLVKLGWTTISTSGIIWLVILFAFGTPHLWLGMDGRMWYMSQIVALTFVALAILLALRSWSPWLIGLSLGLAIWARPNVIMLWPFLLAIWVQMQKDKDEQPTIKKLASWVIRSAVPIGIMAAGLLLYNFARFENPFDFGYATINGNPGLIASIQKYGMFSLHYLPSNLYMMFLKLPTIQATQPYLNPSYVGMSLLVTTPAFFFLIRKYENKIWISGAWASVILSLGLLALYHNNGMSQFGYRYVVDLSLPLICLLAAGIKKKTPLLLLLLIMLSIVINEYGAFWFIRYANG